MTLDLAADFVEQGLASWWAPALAFAAGVVSFASPCVFPLVPGYLSFVTGSVEVEEQARRPTWRTAIPILLFIAGFSAVFTAFYLLLGSAFNRFLLGTTGSRIAGGVITVFGAIMLVYALRLGSPRLYAERRPFLARVRPGPAWAFPLGAAFGAGWTPCIGPVLGGVIAIASAQGETARGLVLLLSYCAGLGMPFLLVGLGVRRLAALDAIKRNYHWIAGVAGGVMIVIGVAILTGAWNRWLGPLRELIGRFETPL